MDESGKTQTKDTEIKRAFEDKEKVMQANFVPYGVYEEIINLLGQWKVLDIKSLSEMCSYEEKYFNLLYKVRKLEKNGYVKGVLTGSKNKHIFLTEKGLSLTPYDSTYAICDENLTHDLTVGRVLRELLKFDGFHDGRMFHQVPGDKVLPDAEVHGTKDGEVFRLAIEVERTQKVQGRVKQKYILYGKEKVFSYAIFITQKKGLFEAYRRYLLAMGESVQEAIILLLDEELGINRFDYLNSQCFYMGDYVSFEELFGAERVLN